MEPSPTPWHLFDNGTEIWAQGPPDAPVIVVADTQLMSGPTSDRARADAQRIVDAVNAYDGLRERNEALHDALGYAISIVCNIENPTVTQDEPWEPLRRRFLDQAEAAVRIGQATPVYAERVEAPGEGDDGR